MKYDEEKWCSWSDEVTLKTMRKSLNLEPIGEKKVNCMRCTRPFIAQTIGGRRNQFFCYDCKEWIAKQAAEWL